jgi:ABC-2 type transport system permease protein
MHEPASSATGTIYDIGYRRYDGERLGRWHTLTTLAGHGLRSAFGFGRGDRARLLPFSLLLLALVPAVVQSWVAAALGDAVRIVEYSTYFQQVEFIFLIFCAAQAPELVTTERHNGVLALYFVRPLHRVDYAAGKLAALVAALLIIGLSAQLTLLAGRVFAAADLPTGWAAERYALLPILGVTLVAALLLGSMALLIASWVKARMLATAAIFGAFLVTAALPAMLLRALGEERGGYAILMNPAALISGSSHWLFGTEPRPNSVLNAFQLPLHYYGIAAVAASLLLTAALLFRYRRLSL